MGFDYKKNRDWTENIAIVSQVGLTIAGSIVFCFYIGFKLDQWLGTKGIFVTLFVLLGIAGGANVAYRQIMEVTLGKKKIREEKAGEPNRDTEM